jgi:hypothetical protein
MILLMTCEISNHQWRPFSIRLTAMISKYNVEAIRVKVEISLNMRESRKVFSVHRILKSDLRLRLEPAKVLDHQSRKLI